MTETLRPTRYSTVAKALHWTIAVLIIGQFIGGKFMTHLGSPSDMAVVYQYHKSFGFIILALSVYRLYWRFSHPVPALPEGMSKLEARIAPVTHWLFYGFMILVPLTGWLYVSSNPIVGTKIFFFLPVFHWPVPQNELTQTILDNAHSALATAMIGLLVLHVAAALKHHYKDGDDVFRGMLMTRDGATGKLAVPAITGALIAAAAVYLIVMAVWGEDHEEGAPVAAETAAADTSASTVAAGPDAWVIVPEGSYIELEGNAFGTEKTATISDIGGSITLDLDDPAAAGAIDVRIGVSAIESGSSIETGELRGSSYFNVGDYPNARFAAETISGGDGSYEAEGTLTIRDVSQPVSLPFTVIEQEGRAIAEGELAINRKDFGLGGSGSDVADSVLVRVRIEATPAE